MIIKMIRNFVTEDEPGETFLLFWCVQEITHGILYIDLLGGYIPPENDHKNDHKYAH